MSLSIARDVGQLVRDYDRYGSGHFFSKDTMRFFKSRVTDNYRRLNDTQALFITSEKRCFDDDTRAYTLRLAEIYLNDDGFTKMRIETIGGFSKLTLARAKTAMKNFESQKAAS